MIISLVLIVIAAAAKAVMDCSAEYRPGYRMNGLFVLSPDYWLKDLGASRKWKNGDSAQGEAFPGSSTIFVFLTDGWHLAQFIFLLCVFMLPFTWVMVTPYWILDFLIIRALFGAAFEYAFYRPLKKG